MLGAVFSLIYKTRRVCSLHKFHAPTFMW